MILSGLESYGTSAQNSALVNEFKGNLFEYLVASAIAKYYGLESDFITSINDSFRQSLSFYETWLRTHDLPLLRSLVCGLALRRLGIRLPEFDPMRKGGPAALVFFDGETERSGSLAPPTCQNEDRDVCTTRRNRQGGNSRADRPLSGRGTAHGPQPSMRQRLHQRRFHPGLSRDERIPRGLRSPALALA